MSLAKMKSFDKGLFNTIPGLEFESRRQRTKSFGFGLPAWANGPMVMQ